MIKIQEEFKFNKDDSLEWLKNIRLAVAYALINKDSSLIFAKNSLQIAEQLNSHYMLFHSYNEMGNCYYDLFDIENAILYYDKSYYIAKANSSFNKNKPLNNVASIYLDQGNTGKAKELYSLMINDYEANPIKDTAELARCYNNFANAYLFEKSYVQAQILYKKGLAILHHTDLELKILIENNISVCYKKLGKYQDALKILDANLIKLNRLENYQLMSSSLNIKGDIYRELNNKDSSIYFYQKALELTDTTDLHKIIDLNFGLSQIYELHGEYEKSLKNYKKYIQAVERKDLEQYNEAIGRMQSRLNFEINQQKLAAREVELLKVNSQFKAWKILTILLLGGIIFGLPLYFQIKKIQQDKIKFQIQAQQGEIQRAQEINKLRSSFFANISHELRTPVTLIKAPLKSILNVGPPIEIKKNLDIISRQADRLFDLITKVLDLSKLDAGFLKLTKSYTNLAQLVESTSHDFKPISLEKNIEFIIDTSNLNINAEVDSEKIRQIITNLLSNAFKFSKPGGKIEIRSFFNNSNSLWNLSISDTGIGISPENQDLIFEKFISIKSMPDTIGTGLGLSLVKELVQLMGGKIKVGSELEKGSCFELEIPISEFNPIASSTNLNLTAESEPKLDERKSILLVEDHEDMSLYLADLLGQEFQVFTTKNGKEALEVALNRIPSLVLSDVMMPIMDGLELSQKLKENIPTNHIPILLLSAKGDRDTKIQGLKSGIIDYLHKPFDPEELLLKIRNVLILVESKQMTHQRIVHSIIPEELNYEISMDEKWLIELKQILEINYSDENLGIEKMSQLLSMSRSQLYRKVFALTGLAPVDLLKDYRLEKAKMMLMTKSGNISEISYKVGFNSPSYFIKCFKDKFQITPSKYLENENM